MPLHLNWKEIGILVQQIDPQTRGLFVDRIIVPEREHFPEGYLKGEWVIRLTGRKSECSLLFSLRPRQPYLAWCGQKGPKASTKATRSPFDLNLNKVLKGTKLLNIEAIPQERVIILWFTNGGENSQQKLGLVLVMIPAAPEAYLVTAPLLETRSESGTWPILTRSRTLRKTDEKSSPSQNDYRLPQGHQAPANPPVREHLLATPQALYEFLETELDSEAFSLRCQNVEKALKRLIKHTEDRLRQSETSLREGQKEENWQKWGDLLKSTLSNPVPISGSTLSLYDYETEHTIDVRCDPRLSLKDQISKFYQNAKRKQRRIDEASSRISHFRESLTQLERTLNHKLAPGDWKGLEKLERTSRISPTHREKEKKTSSAFSWLGKSFVSKDGLMIWVGRSKDENLELTFKHARGNDIWMHIRGRPGAHVLIPLQPGKSAPLETLLDGATLAIHYSGGQHWGKTEVDYTFKKYVKRIKDSSEASYTNNKTLLIEPDSTRMTRLLEQNTS